METLTTKIEDLKHQLAYSLAAIKIKNETLEQLLDDMGEDGHCVCDAAKLQATDALAIQPDDSALKAWLDEPVAWMNVDPRGGALFFRNDVCHVASTPLYAPKGLK